MAVELLDDPDSRIRLGALNSLLDRGFGRPTQTIATDPNTGPIAMHLLAARLISPQILERQPEPQPQTIQHEPQPANLLDAAVPTE